MNRGKGRTIVIKLRRDLLLITNPTREYLMQLGISSISAIQNLQKDQRDEIIREIKSIDGVSIRQLSRVTRISKGIIERA